MRLHRPVLAGLALGAAVLPITAANAAAGVTAAGSALSTATLVTLSVGDLAGIVEAQRVSIASIASTAQNITSAAPSVTFVPITLNGVKKGAVTVTPDSAPRTVGAVTTGSLPLVSATSPSATLNAVGGSAPMSGLTTTLGSAKLLGLDLTLSGGLSVESLADATHSAAGKRLTIENVALPNLADLLAMLGIDIMKLPAGTLNALITDLQVALDSVQQAALDAANNAVDTATQAAAPAQVAFAEATTALAAATTAFDAALAEVTAVPPGTLPEGMAVPIDHEDWNGLSDVAQAAIVTIGGASVGDAAEAYEGAVEDLSDATAALDPLVDAVEDALDDLAGLVEGILDDVALAKIGAADVSTVASVGKTKTAKITGYVEGIEVLGNDVLAAVTGDSKLDVAKIAGDTADDINAQLNTVGTALSNALSGVTGATGLIVPAPQVEILKKSTKTGQDGAFGTATASVSALTISLGTVTVPPLYALDNAAALPAVGAVTGGFKTAPLSVNVGTIAESARFRPGSAPAPAAPNKPTTGNNPGTHPATGGPAGIAIVALVGTALAVGVRRRLRAE